MCNTLMRPVAVVAVALVCGPAGSAAPMQPDKKAAEQEKAIKAFVAEVVAAVGRKDIDAIIGLSALPFTDQPGNIVRDEKDLRRSFRIGLQEKPRFDGKHEVKRIRTFREFKSEATSAIGENAVRDYREVMTEDDLVIHVAVEHPEVKAGKAQWRLLIKLLDGKPRLVGVGEELR